MLRPVREPIPWMGPAVIAAVVLASAGFYFFHSDTRSKASERPASSQSSREARTERAPTAPSSSSSAAAPKKSALRPRTRASAAPDEPEAPPLNPDDVSDPALKSVLAARDDRSAEGTRVLIDNLGSRDAILVAEATKALIARRATEAIGPLAAIDLQKAAGSGLSVIDALGKLGGVAEGSEKHAAVERLLEMLRDEKRRDAPETPGNLLQIYEALGDTQDPAAAPPLEKELLDPKVPRAPKVVIVQALVDIGLPSSKGAIDAARTEQAAQHGDDAFDEEIRLELVATLEEALEAL